MFDALDHEKLRELFSQTIWQ